MKECVKKPLIGLKKKCFPYAIEYENPARESIQWLKSLKGRVQPKPKEWNGEDDYNLQCMIAKVTSDIQKGNVGRNNELIDWLKSLKDRVQPKQEWSEEDEKIRKALIRFHKSTIDIDGIKGDDIIAWLEKQEWSEEDDKIYYSLLADIRTRQDDSTSTLEAYYNEQIDWLKSLKDRIGG